MQSDSTIIFMMIGYAIGGAIVAAFYNWKAKRTEIRMVQNRRGDFVDIAKVYERRAWRIWFAVVVGILAAGGYVLWSMPNSDQLSKARSGQPVTYVKVPRQSD